MINRQQILEKYGKDTYKLNIDTFNMGIHWKFADHIAKRFIKCRSVLDTCTGAGFMAIALAKYVDKVIAIDIDRIHLDQAKENAKGESNDSKIIFIEGNIFEEIEKLENIDGSFLDPDWARPGDDKTVHVHELSDMEPHGQLLYDEVSKKTKNICLRLPKEFDLLKLKDWPKHESEEFYQDGKLKFYCIFFGNLMRLHGKTEFRV